MQAIYETATETVKKIRKVLKEQFPGVRFTVRSSETSQSSSVNVKWTDGPLEPDVKEAVGWMKSNQRRPEEVGYYGRGCAIPGPSV